MFGKNKKKKQEIPTIDLEDAMDDGAIMSDKTSKAITPSAAKVSIPIPNPSSTAEQ